jgi:hypothetical protein
MADDRRKAPPDMHSRKLSQTPREERPFDVWLNRQLHAMYDDIAQEPLPRDVVELIERDGRRAATEGPVQVQDGANHQPSSESEKAARRDKR